MKDKNQEITIAYGNEVQLTTVGDKKKQVYLKISPAFRAKQLKQLKGSPLSVFICYALHSDENGYTWVDDETIKKETGFSITSEIRQKLIKLNYLYQERLYDEKERFRDWIYRIFQPVEDGKKFLIRGMEQHTRLQGKKAYVEENPIQINYRGTTEEEPIVIEEEPSLSPEATKDSIHLEARDLFDYYKQEFMKKISGTGNPPIFNWGQCEKLGKPHIRALGLKRMKILLDRYLDSNDKLYKENAFSLSCFLSTKILHRLNQNGD